jgi:GNAT superfamily N-acetyltransferase
MKKRPISHHRRDFGVSSLGVWLMMSGKNMMLLRACAEHAAALTKIAFAAKGHWQYPDTWIRRWEGVLTITPEYIIQHPTFVAMIESEFVGFCAVQIEAGDARLDHLWVLPSFMRRGVGRALFQHAEAIARAGGAVRLRIVGDPHAEPFYFRMGATLCGRERASMDGMERFLPLFEKAL